MSRFFVILLGLSSVCGTSFSQAQKLPKANAWFTSIVVSDIDKSIAWYSDNLGFREIQPRKTAIPGISIANLSNSKAMIELIQIDGSLSAAQVLEDHPPKTKLQGFFKFGMFVKRLDKWIDHLQSKDVQFHGNTVKDPVSGKRMVILLDPDGNRIQLFEK